MAKYLTKVEIGEQTITDVISDTEPYISNVSLTLSSGMSALAIGGQASDMLRFTLNHSPTAFMDGEAVKFYVAQADVEEENEAETIAETDETATELEVDTDDTGDDSAGETVTPEESAQAEAEQIQRINDAWNFFVPVEEQITATVTDELTEVGTGEGVDDVAEAEWILKGTYYVTQARSMNSGDTIDVTAMDALALLNDEFVPANRTATVSALYADLASQIQSVVPDLIVEDCDEPSDELITLPEGTVSYRQAFGYFAGLFGGYAQVSDDNILQVEYYTASELPLLDSEVTGFTELSSGQIVIEQLTCDNENSNTPTGTHLIQSGSGEGLTFANPWQTQTTLDACLDKLKGLTFIGASVTAMWRPDLVSGCAVRVMTANEWLSWCMGMNEIEASTGDTTALKGSMLDLGRVVLTNYQTITFGDNAVTRIRSELRTTTERENQLVDNSVSDAYRFATDYIKDNGDGTIDIKPSSGTSGIKATVNEDSFQIKDGDAVLTEMNADGLKVNATEMWTPSGRAVKPATEIGATLTKVAGEFQIKNPETWGKGGEDLPALFSASYDGSIHARALLKDVMGTNVTVSTTSALNNNTVFYISTVEIDGVAISGNNYLASTVSVGNAPGYTPLAIVGYDVQGTNVSYANFYRMTLAPNGNTGTITYAVRNTSTTTATRISGQIYFKVLWVMTSRVNE